MISWGVPLDQRTTNHNKTILSQEEGDDGVWKGGRDCIVNILTRNKFYTRSIKQQIMDTHLKSDAECMRKDPDKQVTEIENSQTLNLIGEQAVLSVVSNSSTGTTPVTSDIPITYVVTGSSSSEIVQLCEGEKTGTGQPVTPMISTMTLDEENSPAHFLLERLASGGSHMEPLNGETIQIGVDPSTLVGLSQENGVPVLLEVTENPGSEVIHSRGDSEAVMTSICTGASYSTPLYTIQLGNSATLTSAIHQPLQTSSENPANIANVMHADNQSVIEIQGDHQPLQLLNTTTGLEDLMDVVTTYRCKFCRFSCVWKSGLMSHIRNCHIEAAQKLERSPNSTEKTASKKNYPKTSSAPESSETSESSVQLEREISADHQNNEATVFYGHVKEEEADLSSSSCQYQDVGTQAAQEKHIFLCGHCSRGFDTLDGCKDHMIKDHKLKLNDTETSQAEKTTGRKKGRDWSFLADDNYETLTLEPGKQTSGRKRLSTSKILDDKFFFEIPRKRIQRDDYKQKKFKCNEKGCGYRFISEANLQYHIRCHSTLEKPFCCPECSLLIDHWRGLSMHLWRFHSVDIDLHTCSTCGYKTYSHFKLDNHMRIHSERRDFMCTTCGKSFKQLSQLRNHHVIHLDKKTITEKRWYSQQTCDICQRTFSDSKCLRKHQQTVHSKVKPYVCHFCGHSSARKAMLQLHLRQHTGEKPFLCEICEFQTCDHNSLRRHRMRHTGDKPYKCPHCPYACIQAISYKTHLKNKHPGLGGLFACNLCPFRSVSKDNYVNHMSDHKRGAIPANKSSNQTNSTGQNSSNGSQEMQQDSAGQVINTLHFSDTTLQELEGLLPGNITAAQLIYSCLTALSNDGLPVNLPPGVTTTSTEDGSQTITIQVPATTQQGVGEAEHYYLTIQQQDGNTSFPISAASENSHSAAESTQSITDETAGEHRKQVSGTYVTPDASSQQDSPLASVGVSEHALIPQAASC
ncbi:zinc finger protein ZFAT-like isoform X1 [Limulus polyphemus]|uniref:Zinc finger protein ZFAT-like isoform X1 n=2 Tax=Limulus polyphemus TaxID=6850 RepID=A0ABM1T4R3_LIMPO|nr:zinc finger protein ZFAT-like isoform X1 [Limulus polyphemus]